MNTINLDDISLEQALLDFEVANGRVMDLTARLTSMSRELMAARTDLMTSNLQRSSLEAKLASLQDDLGLVQGKLAAAELDLAGVGSFDRALFERNKNSLDQIRASRAVGIAMLFSSKLRRVLR